jgi:hypothetical protein
VPHEEDLARRFGNFHDCCPAWTGCAGWSVTVKSSFDRPYIYLKRGFEWSFAYDSLFAVNGHQYGFFGLLTIATSRLAIASRNAEFDAANKLLNRGRKLEDIKFTEPVLLWPASGFLRPTVEDGFIAYQMTLKLAAARAYAFCSWVRVGCSSTNRSITSFVCG